MSQTETESEFSEMDSLAYSSSTSVMSQVAYHQKYQALPNSEKLKEDPSITRKYSYCINYYREFNDRI